MQNQFIQTLKSNATLQLNLELADRYNFKHPALQNKEAQLNAKGQCEPGGRADPPEYRDAVPTGQGDEEYVQKLLDETKREVFAFNQKAIQYGAREVQAQSDIYNLLLKRLNETGVTEQPASAMPR